MTRTIAIASQKGGVGKTTATLNIGAGLNRLHGYSVLYIDLDPQANLTTSVIGHKGNNVLTSFHLLTGSLSFTDVVKPVRNGVDIIPAAQHMDELTTKLANVVDKSFLLYDAIEKHIENYDYILMDCPATFELLTLNAFCVATEVYVPVECSSFGYDGLVSVEKIVDKVKANLNGSIEIKGAFKNKYEYKTLHVNVASDLAKAFPDILMNTTVRRNNDIEASHDYMKDIFEYAPKSKGAEYYEQIVKEVIEGAENE